MSNSKEIEPAVHRLHWRLTGVILFSVALLSSFNLATMVVDRESPIDIVTYEALETDVPQGGILSIKFVLERNRYCTSELVATVTDSQGTRHSAPFAVSVIKEAGHQIGNREVSIPVIAALGPAVYSSELHYYCNALQRLVHWPIKVREPDINFKITPELKKAGERDAAMREAHCIIPQIRRCHTEEQLSDFPVLYYPSR